MLHFLDNGSGTVLAMGRTHEHRGKIYRVSSFDERELVLHTATVHEDSSPEHDEKRFVLLRQRQQRLDDVVAIEAELALDKKEFEEDDLDDPSRAGLKEQLVSHKRKAECLSQEIDSMPPKFRLMVLRLPAFKRTDFGLMYTPQQDPTEVCLREIRGDRDTIVDLGMVGRGAQHVILTQNQVIVSSTPGKRYASHSRWILNPRSLDTGAGAALGVLRGLSLTLLGEGEQVTYTLSDVHMSDVHTGKVEVSGPGSVYNPREDIAWCCSHDRFVVLRKQPPSVRFYSLAQDGGLVPDCVFDLDLPEKDLVRGESRVALNPNLRSGQFVVHVYRRLLVYSVSGFKLTLMAQHPIQLPVVELLCREDHIVVVLKEGGVSYLDMHLKPLFHFAFGVPARAAAFHNETWAVLSGDRLLLCQDKFFART